MYITTSYNTAPSLVQRVQETFQPELRSGNSASNFQALHVEQQANYVKHQNYSFLEQTVSHCENCGDQRHTQTYRSISSSTHIEASAQITAVAINTINYFNPTNYGNAARLAQRNNLQQGYASQPLQLGFTYQQKLLEYLPTTSGKTEYHAFESFLKPYRPATPFIGAAEEIQQHIKEAFKATTGKTLPDDILIVVAPTEKIKAVHESLTTAQQWSDNIQGFSINNKNNKERKIFVRQNDLDKVMLVIGHELGHVITAALGNQHDEEAKAFAFELAWMQAIVKENIANLKENINIDCKPANNGLHDVAFSFVQQLVKQGREALEVYLALACGVLGKEKMEIV